MPEVEDLAEELKGVLVEHGPLSIMEIEDHVDERTNDIIVTLNSSNMFAYGEKRWHLTSEAV